MVQFFTTAYGDWPFHLVPYSTWRRGYDKPFGEAIVDPGVNSLRGKSEYPYIDEYPLDVPGNAWWVIPDYPHDVGPALDSKTCIQKTRDNIVRWHAVPKSIPSVQYEFEDFRSFKEAWKWTLPHAVNGIVGIGNLCKSRRFSFLKKVIDHVTFNNPTSARVHFFGLSIHGIRYIEGLVFPFSISIDSMKWDYRLHGNGDSNFRKERWKKFLAYVPKASSKQERLI